MGWFYGFKLHLIVNHQGGIVAAKITSANVHDTKPVADMVFSPMDKLYADKGYISKGHIVMGQSHALKALYHRNHQRPIEKYLSDRALLAP
jgi:IS5 family transposase